MTTIFTIHNLAYQGNFPPDWLGAAGARPRDDVDGRARVLGADQPAQGRHRLFRQHHDRQPDLRARDSDEGIRFRVRRRARRRAPTDLHGILNGIDTDRWDPRRDPFLPEPYDEHSLEKKDAAKRALFELLCPGTPFERFARPLVGIVSRLVDQKGFDLIAELAPIAAELWEFCRARHRRSAVRNDVARAGGGVSRTGLP